MSRANDTGEIVGYICVLDSAIGTDGGRRKGVHPGGDEMSNVSSRPMFH